ncbi:hypothetical protein GCK72_018839 [Caenorhabditis remanei]|uniref:C-type lectin domain-containing protein n=2 Tax=Caenorhabditis remanei TaxID=31234 RepID=A0A6A5GCE7_CAERE|nr:hypothetical protein GCK72_018839 [Caenorhabditis remanei]KAF1752285.1 hypothetical protein GCK72_018839 [Caenorhabditis remanei]
MKFTILVLCVCLLKIANSLNLNDIKKVRTNPTTIATTTTMKPTTTTKTTTTTTVYTSTTKPVEHSVVDPGPMLIDCQDACPTGWQYYNSNCYKKFDSGVTYSQAVSACSGLGAQLVTIDNFDENDALRKAFDTNTLFYESQETWIGLKFVSGSWTWSGGSEASYINWAPTQPASGQCVQMITDALINETYKYQRGGWKTYDCSKISASYICERPAGSTELLKATTVEIDWD